jgi:DNA-binding CsgD family transcriptional regulator
VRAFGLTAEQQDEVWQRWRAGASLRAVARQMGINRPATVRCFVASSGGVRRPARRRDACHLTAAEREEISRGVAAGESCRALARRLGRAPSTINRELARNGGRRRYRARAADAAADRRAQRPKPCKLSQNERLRAAVERGLRRRWSPQQIAARLVVKCALSAFGPDQRLATWRSSCSSGASSSLIRSIIRTASSIWVRAAGGSLSA